MQTFADPHRAMIFADPHRDVTRSRDTQDPITAFTGPGTFAFVGLFLHKDIFKIIYHDYVGIKTNIKY